MAERLFSKTVFNLGILYTALLVDQSPGLNTLVVLSSTVCHVYLISVYSFCVVFFTVCELHFVDHLLLTEYLCLLIYSWLSQPQLFSAVSLH